MIRNQLTTTMQLEWEEFETGQPASAAGQAIHVTLSPRRNFFLNRAAVKALREAEAVIMLYDRRRAVVGLKPAEAGHANSIGLKRKDGARDSGRVIYAANFCSRYGIAPRETVRFTNPKLTLDGVLILSLHETKPAARKGANG